MYLLFPNLMFKKFKLYYIERYLFQNGYTITHHVLFTLLLFVFSEKLEKTEYIGMIEGHPILILDNLVRYCLSEWLS